MSYFYAVLINKSNGDTFIHGHNLNWVEVRQMKDWVHKLSKGHHVAVGRHTSEHMHQVEGCRLCRRNFMGCIKRGVTPYIFDDGGGYYGPRPSPRRIVLVGTELGRKELLRAMEESGEWES